MTQTTFKRNRKRELDEIHGVNRHARRHGMHEHSCRRWVVLYRQAAECTVHCTVKSPGGRWCALYRRGAPLPLTWLRWARRGLLRMRQTRGSHARMLRQRRQPKPLLCRRGRHPQGRAPKKVRRPRIVQKETWSLRLARTARIIHYIGLGSGRGLRC